jgi:hypothetical protein
LEYLGGSIRAMGGHPQEIGGVGDHVHLAVSLKPTHQLSKVLQELKKNSSTWIRKEFFIADFAWQDGYAAFTVSTSNVRAVVKYVQNQEEHHRERSFLEELEILLTKSGVPYDPKYLD